MRYGRDTHFSCKGIQIVIQYWEKNGHPVIGFMPEYLFDYKQVERLKQEAKLGKTVKASKLPDSVHILNKLAKKGVMVKTPAQDYDDSYCITYAKNNNAFIVTNDKFRDYLRKIEV